MFAETRTLRLASICKLLPLAVLWLAAVGCTPDVKDLRVEGIEQYRNRQHVESMATLRYALKLNPADAESNYYMGLNYRALASRRFNDGDVPAARKTLDVAIMYFNRAVKAWPNYMAAVSANNEALEARGKYEAALTVAERVADNNRGIAEHFVFLGDEYRERGDFDNALRAYKTALATAPDSAKAYAGLGKLYLRAGDRRLAADSFQKAHELDPAETDAAEALAGLELESDTVPVSHEPKQ